MRRPTFLVIGATKAGTSSLRYYLQQHPSVFIPGGWKEPGFFCFDEAGDSMFRLVRDEEAYYGLFNAVKDETAWGEITPHYLTLPQAAANIHAAVPNVRLIASLRNPVDRAFSLYQMNLRNKGHNRGVQFVDAVRRDPILGGSYFDEIARFRALFPAEQLQFLIFDELIADPVGTTQSIFGFIGVDPSFAPETEKIVNPGGLPRSRLLHLALYNRTARRIGGMFIPMSIQSRLKAIRNANLVPQRLTPEERADVAPLFHDDILRTQDLIERDLSHWLAPAP